MAVKIPRDPDPGENLPFYGGLPSVCIGAVDQRKIRIVKGVTEKDVARGNLRASRTGEQKQRNKDQTDFSHDKRPYLSERSNSVNPM
jgi:hypothetical protein